MNPLISKFSNLSLTSFKNKNPQVKHKVYIKNIK